MSQIQEISRFILRFTIAVVVHFTLVNSVYAQDYVLDWINQYGGQNTQNCYRVDTDSLGNVYTAGDYHFTTDFDPGPGVFNMTSNGSTDMFFSKMDPNGNFLWAKSIGGTSFDNVGSMVVDHDGNLIASLRANGTVDMDPGPNVLNYSPSPFNFAMYIVKLNTNGDLVWVKQFAGTSGSLGLDMVIDDNNDIIVTGYCGGTIDFDPGPGSFPITTFGNSDVFVLRLDANGDFVWAKQLGGIQEDRAEAISIDPSGNIVCAGRIEGTADMDPSAAVANLVSNGDDDPFLVKLTSNGDYLWSVNVGGTGSDWGLAVATDTSGNVILGGDFAGTADFDPTANVNNITSNGSDDIFIQKYSPTGTLQWTQAIGGNGADRPYSIVTEDNGDIMVLGAFQLTVDFDPGPSVDQLVGFGQHDIYLQRLDANGNHLFVDRFGGINAEYGWDLERDLFGDYLFSGRFISTADFDPGIDTFNLTTTDWFDGYVLKLRECFATSAVDSVSACGPYTWIDGNIYTSSNNTAVHVIPNALGCDSVVTLALSVNNPTSSTDIVTACDSYTWIDGNTYTSSNNTATHIIPNAAGCDSIISLDLTLTNSSTSTDSHVACDTFVWIDGNTYTSSNNTATYIIPNAAGCDSVIALDLTLNTSTTGTDVITVCDSYTWIDGNTYTSSNNTATHIIPNAAGCDSVITLNLTLNSSTALTDVITACDSMSWLDGNTYTSSNNTATHVLTNSVGCDSIITLDLTVNYSTTFTDSHVACDTFVWIDGNSYDSDNSSGTYTLTNAAGCDSVIILDVTFLGSTSAIDTHTVCDSLIWIDGNVYTSANSSATHIIPNAQGCDSIITLDLTIQSVNVTTSMLNDITITADAVGVQYQWLDCTNGYAVIPGETGQTFVAASNGSYAVQIIENNCMDTSDCMNITQVGMPENQELQTISVSPNPTSGKVTVSLEQQVEQLRMELFDLRGRQIMSRITENTNTTQLTIQEPSGMYLLHVYTGEMPVIFRIVKE